MKSFPVPFRLIAVWLLSGVLVFLGIMNLRDRAAWVDPTDGIYWSESDEGLKATYIDPAGPGMKAGIRPADRLISFNGNAINSLEHYSDLLYQSGIGATVIYEVVGEKGKRTIDFRLGSKPFFTRKDGLRALLAFLHLGIGIFVIIRAGRLPRAFHFFLICLAAFVVYLYSWTPRLGVLDWWVYGISVLAFLILPGLFVHFCMRFPVDSAAGSSRAWLLYVPAALFILLQLFWILGHLASLGLPRTAESSAFIDNLQLTYFSLGFLTGGILLLKRRLLAHDLIVRQQMKWISYGTLAGIAPFSLFYALPALSGMQTNFAMESSMLSLGLIPLAVGYALIRYRLMDVEAIARRGAAYFIASSFLLALYLLFVLVLGRALQWIAPQANFLAICLAALSVALLFAPLRNRVQVWLDRRFYQDQFEDRTTLLEFAQTLSSEINLEPLARNILERVSRAFKVEKGALFVADQAHSGFLTLASCLGGPSLLERSLFRMQDLIIDEDPRDLAGLKESTNPLRRSGPALARAGLCYTLELKLHGKQVGILAMGRLPKDRHFSTEDLDLLSALAGYAAIALENASLYRSVETKAVELARLKAYADNIIESINVAVLALDAVGSITSCNRAFEELYDISRCQIVGIHVEEILPANVIAAIQGAAGKKDWDLQFPVNIFKQYLENRAARKLIVNLSVIPLRNTVAEDSGSLIVLDDITEKVQLENQLLQAEKLSAIGLLAAGIAHEVNTPIAGISSYTQMLLKETPDSDKRKPILEKIEKQTFRAAEIVNGLLNFSRLNGSEFTELDINQVIKESLALLGHQFESSHIRVESQLDTSLPPVYGNMGKLQQVFVNLFLNARDAMPSGGELVVQTGMEESMVVVDISDTGIGIPQENIKKIFDPFFTTKTVGKGTGLGLAVTYGIIQEHGGGIFVDSNSGKGTRFRLKLPTRLH